MNVLVRTDASYDIGSGHLMRCLTLASFLKAKGARVLFVCRELPGNMIQYIMQKDVSVFVLPYIKQNTKKGGGVTAYESWLGEDINIDAEQTINILLDNKFEPDLLIIDHYSLDTRWEKKLRPLVKKIMVIDDLADRSHDCDILLDQNLHENMKMRYTNLIDPKCQLLLGPKYSLLREEFINAKNQARPRRGPITRILIFFGGIDKTDETTKALQAVGLLNNSKIFTDVIVGHNNPNKKSISTLCSQSSLFNYFCQVNNIAQLMLKADICIGAGGSSAWERCALGLPSILISIAENQEPVCTSLAQHNACIYLGRNEAVNSKNIAEILTQLIVEPELLSILSKNSMKLVDSHGAKRVLVKIMNN